MRHPCRARSSTPIQVLRNAATWDYTPGSNLPGDLYECDWRFLLPRLSFETTVCFGAASPTTLRGLSDLSTRVLSVSPVTQTDGPGPGLLPDNVVVVDPSEWRNLGIGGTADLLYFACPGELRRLVAHPDLFEDALALLKPTGVIFSELFGGDKSRARKLKQALQKADLGSGEPVLLGPWSPSFRSAAPVGDRTVMKYCRSLSSPRKLRSRVLLGLKTLWRPYRWALVAGRQRPDNAQVPDYVDAAAARSGISLTGYRWGFVAGGRYPSKKVVFTLFKNGCPTPEAIVKLTRHPSFNRRLENEFHSLQALHKTRAPEAKAAPKALFLGNEGGLVLAAQTAVQGRPLQELSEARPDSPHTVLVVNWLVSLAWKTARKVQGTEVASSLSSLADRFCDNYSSPAEERHFLATQISKIGKCPDFPVVFQHGDPHPGNILITPDDRLVLLDWESAEPAGMPLWDLFYFLHTTARLAVGRRRTPGSLILRDLFLTSTGWKGLLQGALSKSCEALQLDRHLIKPLFYLCWMHRALKEATRLPVNQAAKGTSVELLRFALAHDRDPNLSALLC